MKVGTMRDRSKDKPPVRPAPAPGSPGGQITQERRKEGAAAKAAGLPQSANPYPRDRRPENRAWNEGWEQAAAPDRGPPRQDRQVLRAPSEREPWPPANDARFFGQGDVSKPIYRQPVRDLVPCPACRRLRLDSLSQACVVHGIHRDVANMKCRGCGHAFKAPVVVEGSRSGPGV